MLFITKEHLKPGMVIAKDINLYSDDDKNLITLLLSKGQVLNQVFINKIIFHDIAGVYIENEAFNDITIEPVIDSRLEARAVSEIKEVFSEFKACTGKINTSSVRKISKIVDDLIVDILNKKELSNNIIEFKNHDCYTYFHCLNVAVLSITTGISLGLSEHMLHELGVSGLLHDIGKMLIPPEIINKKETLTQEEFEIIKKHPKNAVKQLEHLVSYDILRGIESHHEKLDGSGYPYGRTNGNIHLYGKILAICDVYDALTSDRSYRKTCFPSEVIEYIMGCAGSHFDYEILCKFLKNIVAYPLGTFVKLSLGSIGVVIKNYPENIMRPVVRIINQDNTVGDELDLLYDHNLMNVTITGMGYDYDSIDYNKISKPVI